MSEETMPGQAEDEFFGSVWTINSESKQRGQQQKDPSTPISMPAVKVSIEIENVELQMEVDT